MGKCKVLYSIQLFALLSFGAQANDDKVIPLPAEFQGFKGTLVGQVVSQKEFDYKVKVLSAQPSQGSKAKNADSVVGKTVWVKYVCNLCAKGQASFKKQEKQYTAKAKAKKQEVNYNFAISAVDRQKATAAKVSFGAASAKAGKKCKGAKKCSS